ncbi:MAG: SOS response-associated peptidase [Chloroflexota bacterium]
MCGRFAQSRSAEELARIFHARPAAEVDGERFNVAPTDEVAAVVEHHGERVVDAFRWGLVPFYAKSAKDGARMINARAETVETSPAFRTAFARRRCIVPADAFYEWRRERNPETGRTIKSEPFAVRRSDGEPLALAGLWSIWRDPDTAARLYTCTILTTEPNELVARIHNRMPVILDPTDWAAWLTEVTPAGELRSLLRPAPVEPLEAYAVSPAVNNVRNEGPELLAPLSRWSDGL